LFEKVGSLARRLTRTGEGSMKRKVEGEAPRGEKGDGKAYED